MNTRRRLALVMVALPLAFYGYACSSDDSTGGGDTDAGGSSETGPNPGLDSSTGTDTSTGTDSSSGTDSSMVDASDGAVLPTCIGNPLTADGGNLDGGVTLDGAVATQIVSSPGNFLDGPTWFDANGGFLVYSEYDQTERLLRVAPDGGANVTFRDAGFSNATGPVGNAVRSGLLITTVNDKNATSTPGFVLTAPDGGPVGSVIPLGDAGSNSPNDLVVGPNNNVYFTDGQYQVFGTPGVAGLYQLYPDAAVRSIQQNFGRANGIALSPDSKKLYVGVGPFNTGEPDKKKVLVYDVSATGVVSNGTTFLTENDLVDVPDGMATDVGGNLWIAEATTGGAAGGRVEVFSPTKKRLGTIPFTTERPTGVAFGGTDGKTLFITTETGVFTYVSRCAGVR